ncbi:XRE family transcriptional regulator [Alkalihalobacillus alcalophilus ATCC 27647 = CGMCC 1.3604]|uniref:LexA repressor n=1 Tax=Alkalihalobacillus alcalophilus ATCC 27647 = CGMCC 1.3604 TaxID=1218173 RepID=A0A094WHN4_ALKAL|nr:transcriptional repressor LexA [Alkalihalobacillus alcalophilus]KGA97294.1 XRE family transcriptional regulator [Alkalihalobacillus alcalophilus ATCC 27647 = CGMCC 1.3604]MED1564066.1 transcriptional repressor LexA [Alkalihalobacillus alcalophilus]
MTKLSKRQQEILDYIKVEVRKKGYPPSVREIGEAVGLASSSTVHGHLSRLEKKGYIRRDPTKPRAIEILNLEDNMVEAEQLERKANYIPIIGKVTAGVPITAIENVEGYLPLPEHLAANEQTYVLVIEGDSMIEAGIFNGDMVIVKQQQTANNGDIIVAMTEDEEATVKRFFKEKDYIRLQPENSTMDPILLKEVTILGKVIGVFRTIH